VKFPEKWGKEMSFGSLFMKNHHEKAQKTSEWEKFVRIKEYVDNARISYISRNSGLAVI
jgi:hypothetical protein